MDLLGDEVRHDQKKHELNYVEIDKIFCVLLGC